jgi:hypothetical protein
LLGESDETAASKFKEEFESSRTKGAIKSKVALLRSCLVRTLSNQPIVNQERTGLPHFPLSPAVLSSHMSRNACSRFFSASVAHRW